MHRLRAVGRWVALVTGLWAMFACGLVPMDARAQTLEARSAEHDGFGRLVFNWDAPVRYAAEIRGNRLLVGFSAPFDGSMRHLVAPLSGYIEGVEKGSNGRTLAFSLKGSFEIRSSTSGNSIIVDLVGKPVKGAAAPSAEKKAAEPTAEPAAGGDVPLLGVRTGEHPTFMRMVFDWRRPVDYRVDQGTGQATVTFTRPARLDMTALRDAMPEALKGISSALADNRLTVTIPLGPGSEIRHFRSGQGVAIDVVNPAMPTGQTAQAAPTPAPAAKTPQVVNPDEKVAAAPAHAAAPPPTPAPVPTPKGEAPAPLAAPVAPVESAPLEPTLEAVPGTEPQAAPADAATAEQGDQVAPEEAGNPADDRFASLSFSWDKPTAAAVFRRSGHLWVVFDRMQEVDLKLLKRLGGGIVLSAEQVPHGSATVVRLITEPGFNPSLRREGLLWVVDMMRQPLRAQTPIKVEAQPESPFGPRLFLPVTESGGVVKVQDPEVGDSFFVVPVIPLSNGIFPDRGFPDLVLPATAQGVVVEPLADGIEVKSSRTGIEVLGPPEIGLHLSRDTAKLASMAQLTSGENMTQAFDVKAWARGGLDKFRKDQEELMTMVSSAPDNLNPMRMEVARHYFANGFGAEALGVLQRILDDDPTILNTGAFRALRGASNFLERRYVEAVDDLSHPSLTGNDEAAFWRAAAESYLSPPELQAQTLREKADVSREYSHQIRLPLSFAVIRAAVFAGDDLTAQNFLAAVDSPSNSHNDNAALDYWEGKLNESTGAFDAAVASFERAEKSTSRMYRALASMDRIELELKLEKIDAAQAIEQMERLRYAWRGDEFEFRLLNRLGELYMAAGDYGNGLRTLKVLASAFKSHPEAPKATKMMRDAFERLYLEGQADNLAPVTAIALYDEFRELTPTGDKGDQMIAKLADRLAAVDLLDRAASLLDRQVKLRLSGVEKARVGARLALLHLLNRAPKDALDILALSDMKGLPEELATERRHLQARAMIEMGQLTEAIGVLSADATRDGRLLLGEIYWKNKAWAQAAAVLETMIRKPAKGARISDEETRLVLDRAAALMLAKDANGLVKIRRDYQEQLQGTPYAEMFDLLTAPPETGMLDYTKLGQKIKLAEGFQSFMNVYKDKLRNGGLSSIMK